MAGTLAAQPRLDKDGAVAVLHLGSGENRLNPESVTAIEACLDEVEAGDFQAMVTAAEGKIWCNGMDVVWIAAQPERADEALQRAEVLLARVLAFPLPTVAAIGGHAFAGGMLLALAHDLRVMRADRGYLCLPEVTFKAVFSPGMIALLQARMTPQVAHRAILGAERFDAASALAAQLVDETQDLDGLIGRAVALAGERAGHDRETVVALKRGIYADALAKLGTATLPAALLAALRDLEG